MAKNQEVVMEGKLNEVIVREWRRPDGSLGRSTDYSFCPTLTEQHTAHLSDLNYLIDKYKPDELAAYLAARTQHRTEILGHDFSVEPELMDAKNTVYRMKKAFEELPEDIKMMFKNHIEFLKFIDNPDNQDKMIKLGLLKPLEIKELTGEENVQQKQKKTKTQDEDLKANA